MVKNSVLTPVLAAVLGVTVLGSGAAYYFMGKNSNSDNKSVKSNVNLTQVGTGIKNTITKAENAVMGKMDCAYDANAKITFNEGITGLVGMNLEPLNISAKTNQNSGKTSADIKLGYGSKTLATLNAVYDSSNKDAYVCVPELSKGYLKFNLDYLKKQLSSSAFSTALSGDNLSSMGNINFDSEAIKKDLQEYKDLVDKNLPQGKDSGKLDKDVYGIKTTYTSKTYTVSGADLQKTVKAVVNKAKTDEQLSKLYSSKISGMSYSEFVKSISSNADTMFTGDELKKTSTFTVYYNSKNEFAGFKMDNGKVNAELYTVCEDTQLGVDFKYSDSKKNSVSLNGSVSIAGDGKTNGSFDFKSDLQQESSIVVNNNTTSIKISSDKATASNEVKLTLKDVVSTQNSFKGDIRIDYNTTSDEKASSGWYKLTSNSTDDKADLSFDVGVNGQSYVTVAFTGSESKSSEVKLPTGKIYDMSNEAQMNQYEKTVDTKGFTKNIKAALGDKLYNTISSFGSMFNGSGSTSSNMSGMTVNKTTKKTTK